MKNTNRTKLKFDVLVIVGILIFSAVSLILLGVFRENGTYLIITVDGDEVERYPLSENIETEIVTEYGKNVITISDRQAEVTFADCPDGICSSHRPIGKSGESIVCLPHKLVLTVINSGEGE